MSFEILLNSKLFAFALAVSVLYYFYHSRFRGSPTLITRYPLSILAIDFLFLPLLIACSVLLVTQYDNHELISDNLDGINLAKSGLLYLATFWLIARFLDVLILQRLVFLRTGFTTPLLLRWLAYGVITFSGLALFLWKIDHPVTGFVVSTGLIAAIMGFALQSTLSNLFAGLALSLEKPFKIGDWIELQDKTVGQVSEITWRSIWLQTFNNTKLFIPNSVLANQQVTNLSDKSSPYSQWYFIKVSPQHDPQLVKTLLASAVGRCRHVLSTPSPSIRLNDASENPYIYSIWVNYRDYLAHFRGQEELFTQTNRALKQAGMEVSSNVQEIRISRKQKENAVSMDISETLRSLEVFNKFTDEQVCYIAEHAEVSMIEADTIVIREKQNLKNVFIVLNGNLESSVNHEIGQGVKSESLGAGDSFGWSALFVDDVSFMRVTAKTDTLLLTIDDEKIRSVLKDSPPLVEYFTLFLSKRMKLIEEARLSGTKSRGARLSTIEIKKYIEKFIRS